MKQLKLSVLMMIFLSTLSMHGMEQQLVGGRSTQTSALASRMEQNTQRLEQETLLRDRADSIQGCKSAVIGCGCLFITVAAVLAVGYGFFYKS